MLPFAFAKVANFFKFAVEGKRSSHHRIVNNLPGIPDFCPTIYETLKPEEFVASNIQNKKDTYINGIHKEVMQRAAAFLLLKDSKASFTIEGENPGTNRALRWGKAIGEAGKNPLTKNELLRLQEIIIESKRFTKMGFRTEGGFVGDRERTTSEPIPYHISAKWQDVDQLIGGLINAYHVLDKEKFDPILTATATAFCFYSSILGWK